MWSNIKHSIKLDSIREAESVTASVAKTTPLYKLENLSKTVGKPVYIKDESLQHTSSFKLRGVYYCIYSKIKNLIQEGKLNKRLYITTQSTGNHGIATLYSIYKILEENVFEAELKLLDGKTIFEQIGRAHV